MHVVNGTPEGRYVLLVTASARSSWPSALSRLATTGAAPIEVVRCVSLAEVKTRLDGGRPFSAVVLDASMPGADRDLADRAQQAGAVLVLVDDGRVERVWEATGAAAVLPLSFDRHQLLDALTTHAVAVRRVEATAPPEPIEPPATGPLFAVTGPGGTGASTVSIALAQAIADAGQRCVLADLRLDASLAMLHGTPDVAPGVPELLDACRVAMPDAASVIGLTFAVVDRGYDLLLGLRRHRDWTLVRRRATDAALGALRATYHCVVAEIDPDWEGVERTGAPEVEERNTLARSALAAAAVVLVVGRPGLAGIHALVRTVGAAIDEGAEPSRLVPVVNQAPRHPRARAEIQRAVADLSQPVLGRSGDLPPVVFVPHRRATEACHRDGKRLPAPIGQGLWRAVAAVTALVGDRPAPPLPQLVVPGSLGAST